MKKNYIAPSMKEIAMRCESKLMNPSKLCVNSETENMVSEGEELAKEDNFFGW